MTRVIMVVGATDEATRAHLDGLVTRLRARGDDVLVLTDPRLTDDRATPAEGLKTDAAPQWPTFQRGVKAAVTDLVRLRQWASQADVVHAHGTRGGLLGAFATSTYDRPRLIVSQHRPILATGWRGLRGHLVQWLTARRADLVTGASSDLVASAAAHGARRSWAADVPSPHVRALLEGDRSDDERALRRRELVAQLGASTGGPIDPELPVVLTVCAAEGHHRVRDVLDAAEEVRTPVTWVVLGDETEEELATLDSDAAARDLPVRLAGPDTEANRLAWLQAADVFVLPSRWESRALAVQDAMAAGVPVVTTDVGGLHELVREVGVLVPLGDPLATGGAVDAVLADPSWAAELAAAGRRRAGTWEDDDETAQRWHQWYVGPYP